MPTNFPTALDDFTNPTASDPRNSVTVPHAEQHANANDAIEALQVKVGIDGSADTDSLDYQMSKAARVDQSNTFAQSQVMSNGIRVGNTNGITLMDGNTPGSSDDAAIVRVASHTVEVNGSSIGGVNIAFVPRSEVLLASTNNYNPGPGVTHQLLGIGGPWTVNGINAGYEGEVKLFHNVGSENVLFANESGSATAADRILTPGSATLTLTPGSMAIAFYRTGSARWYMAGLSALGGDLTALEALGGTNTIYYRSAADTWSAVTIGTGLSFAGGVLADLTAPVVPAQITSDQNDYAGATGRFNLLSTDASRTLTGMVAGSNGEPRQIINVGSNDLVLAHQDNGSSASNRFITTTGASITLAANEAAGLLYETTTNRWRVFK